MPGFLYVQYSMVFIAYGGYHSEHQDGLHKRLMNWINQTTRETREHVTAVAVILLITVIFFWPLLQRRTFSMVGAHMLTQYPWAGIVSDSPDVVGRDYYQNDQAEGLYPSAAFATNAVRSGQFPMWLPYSFSGVPIMETGSVGNGYVYPPQLLATMFFVPFRQHDLLLFTHLLLAGLGMYALLRGWGANFLGALFGAIVWEWNGHNSFWLMFEFFAVAAAWLPLIMLGATLAVRKRSLLWALAAGAVWGMSLLHGIQHSEYLGSVVLTCWYALITILAARKLFRAGARRSALLCLSLPVISIATAAALSAASWLPLLNLLTHVHRQPFSLKQQLGAVPFRAFARGLIFPRSAVGPEGKLDIPALAFVGIPALIFVLPGLFRRSLPVFFSAIVGLISIGMILGLRPLIILLRLLLPYFAAMRTYDAYYLFCFSIAVLAGFGLTEIGQILVRPGVRKQLLLGFACSLIAVECLQLIMFARIINPSHPASVDWLYPETPMITTLRNLQGEFHVLPVSVLTPSYSWTPVLSGKVPAAFGLRSTSGYESLLPVWTESLWKTVEQNGTPPTGPRYFPYRSSFPSDQLPLRLLEKLSVGFLATAPNREPGDVDGSKPLEDGSLRRVYQGPDGDIYKVTQALPRAFLVPGVIAAPDPEASLRMLVDPKFDVRRAAIVIGDDAAGKTGLPAIDSSVNDFSGTVTIVSDRLNDVGIEVNTTRPAMLVLHDSWDSGWNANVDGMAQPVLRVNYAFRGVVLPEGKHQVVFRYRPPLVLLGLGISALAILLLLIVFAGIGIHNLRRFYQRLAKVTPNSEPAPITMLP